MRSDGQRTVFKARAIDVPGSDVTAMKAWMRTSGVLVQVGNAGLDRRCEDGSLGRAPDGAAPYRSSSSVPMSCAMVATFAISVLANREASRPDHQDSNEALRGAPAVAGQRGVKIGARRSDGHIDGNSTGT